MKDKETGRPTETDEKLHISKSIFQVNKENKEKAAEEERRRAEERERLIAERRRRAEEARDKRLEEERREMIRLKQGVIEESETIEQEPEKEVKRSIFKRIGSFFYLNKWWLGIGGLFAVIAIMLGVNFMQKPRPDMEVILLGENYSLGLDSDLEGYISSFAEDYNHNGKVYAMVNYIAYTGEELHDYSNSVQTKMTAVFQSDEAVIVIGNEDAAKLMESEDIFTDLTSLYPGTEHVKGDKFMLDGTDFAQRAGVDPNDLGEGWFIAIRSPKKLAFSGEKHMQEIYDRDFAVFDAIIKDLS